ncbi:MAG: hypothetical protein MZW92_24645 [Comamonadaceae bacterium]|nr:hypothetical protein [Comamonadaceae bacterium]
MPASHRARERALHPRGRSTHRERMCSTTAGRQSRGFSSSARWPGAAARRRCCVSGKRTLSKLNAFDLIVTAALGLGRWPPCCCRATSRRPRASPPSRRWSAAAGDHPWLSVRSRRVGQPVKAEPTLPLFRGRPLEQAMKRERVTRDEPLAAVRAEQGHAGIEQVHAGRAGDRRRTQRGHPGRGRRRRRGAGTGAVGRRGGAQAKAGGPRWNREERAERRGASGARPALRAGGADHS